MSAAEQSVTGTKILRGRGRARATVDLIAAMHDWLAGAYPTTVRAVCYAMFIRGLIPSMERKNTARISRVLTQAREEGAIPWAWIVDESREIEGVSTWRDPAEYVRAVARSYRRDFWAQQPNRVLLVSEKGTVRGTLRPLCDEYGVDFLSVGGFSGASTVKELATTNDGRPLRVLYVGDWDPSGLFMSAVDLPGRLERYGGHHITVERIALQAHDLPALPSFPANTKRKDPRYKWFVERYGHDCWELDAMHPEKLRERVEWHINEAIEWTAWERCQRNQESEQESLQHLLDQWKTGSS